VPQAIVELLKSKQVIQVDMDSPSVTDASTELGVDLRGHKLRLVDVEYRTAK
jgi:hypothetical protein